jgi:hypothetical protein
MYKIKRHKLLNLYYIHGQYSGIITSDYEAIEEVEDLGIAYLKLKEYEENQIPNIDGIFEDYYRYEHMKGLWGVLEGIQPTIGQLFFYCVKEGHGQKRTPFELCEVRTVNEPFVIVYNHAQSKSEKMTMAAFQGLALVPERDPSYITNWEVKTKIRYPKNLISKLKGVTDYRQVRNRVVSLSKNITDWDLPVKEFINGLRSI